MPYQIKSKIPLNTINNDKSLLPIIEIDGEVKSSTEAGSTNRFFRNSSLLIDEDEQSFDEKFDRDAHIGVETRKRHHVSVGNPQPYLHSKQRRINMNTNNLFLRTNDIHDINRRNAHLSGSRGHLLTLQNAFASYDNFPTHLRAREDAAHFMNRAVHTPYNGWGPRHIVADPNLHRQRQTATNLQLTNDRSKPESNNDPYVMTLQDISPVEWTDNRVSNQTQGEIVPDLESTKSVLPQDERGQREDPYWYRTKFEEQWHMRYLELIEYKKEHGHCNIPRNYEENEQLATWVAKQRSQYKLMQQGKESHINARRVEALDKIGFDWSPAFYMLDLWQQRFDELLKFKAKHGHCNVPQKYEQNRKLAIWVNTQRSQYKKMCAGEQTHMTIERVKTLEDVGFEWSPDLYLHDLWQKRYDELVEYKKMYGNCNVPKEYRDNKQLGSWVNTQRKQFKKLCDGKRTHMTAKRIDALEDIGFVWKIM